MDEEDLKAALLVALLHDIGQYPLAHDLEEAVVRLAVQHPARLFRREAGGQLADEQTPIE